MAHPLLASTDAALDAIAAATDYAHPLVDPEAVAWLEEQFELRLGPTGRFLRPHPNEMAEVLPADCTCDDSDLSVSRATCQGGAYTHLGRVSLARWQAAQARHVSWDDPLMPEHLRPSPERDAARVAAREYAVAHRRASPAWRVATRLRAERRAAAAYVRAHGLPARRRALEAGWVDLGLAFTEVARTFSTAMGEITSMLRVPPTSASPSPFAPGGYIAAPDLSPIRPNRANPLNIAPDRRRPS